MVRFLKIIRYRYEQGSIIYKEYGLQPLHNGC